MALVITYSEISYMCFLHDYLCIGLVKPYDLLTYWTKCSNLVSCYLEVWELLTNRKIKFLNPFSKGFIKSKQNLGEIKIFWIVLYFITKKYRERSVSSNLALPLNHNFPCLSRPRAQEPLHKDILVTCFVKIYVDPKGQVARDMILHWIGLEVLSNFCALSFHNYPVFQRNQTSLFL